MRSIYDLCYSPYFAVNDRISPHTVTAKHDHNTRSCNRPKYGRKRIVYGSIDFDSGSNILSNEDQHYILLMFMITDEKVVKTGYTITMSATKYKKLVTCHHGAKVVLKRKTNILDVSERFRIV